MARLRERFGSLRSRLMALNVHDAALRLTEGGCDLLIAYHHPSQPLQLDPERYEMVVLGHETLAPYAQAGPDGQPRYRLPGQPGQPVPLLAYAPGAYLGGITEALLKQAGVPIHLDRVYETDMAEGLKLMAVQGHGLAFLPSSAVRKEVAAGTLVALEGAHLQLSMDIRAYRARPGPRQPIRPDAQALWDHLTGDGDTDPA